MASTSWPWVSGVSCPAGGDTPLVTAGGDGDLEKIIFVLFVDILYIVYVRGYLAAGRENAWGLSSLTEPPRVSGVCTGAKVWSLLLSRRLLLPMWSFFFRSSSRSDMFFILGGTGACAGDTSN